MGCLTLVMGLPDGLQFRTKGQLAIDVLTETLTGGTKLDFVCGDEVYGACTELREFCEERGQGYVLRVPSTFRLTLARGITMTCAQASETALSSAGRSRPARAARRPGRGPLGRGAAHGPDVSCSPSAKTA